MIPTSRRTAPGFGHRRAVRPVLEGLEDRMLLYATTGGQWANTSRITYSFAPDGANIGGYPNTMNATMTSLGISTATWQQQFQRAAATWASVTGINLVQVEDDGSTFGTSGYQQGDSRFGDIRIGAMTQSAGVLATTFLPPPFNGGTIAGDIVFNTTPGWRVNNPYDVLTVAIHEFGHALGMDHSEITYADMYAAYNQSLKQSLTADDTAGIKAIYGTRQPDSFDATASNGTPGTASNITSYLNNLGQITLPNLDITTNNDSDWYYVVAPANTTGTMTVTVQSSGLSSLGPKVFLLNSALTNSVSASTTDYGGTVNVSFSGIQSGQGFYIRVMAATVGPQGVGAYGLQVNFGSSPMAPIVPPVVTVAQQPDMAGGASGFETTEGPESGRGSLAGDLFHATVRLGDQISSATGQARIAWQDGGMAQVSGTVQIKGEGQRGVSGQICLVTPGPASSPGQGNGLARGLAIGPLANGQGVAGRRVVGVLEVVGLGHFSVSGTVNGSGKLDLDFKPLQRVGLGGLAAWGDSLTDDPTDDLRSEGLRNQFGFQAPGALQGGDNIADPQVLDLALLNWDAENDHRPRNRP